MSTHAKIAQPHLRFSEIILASISNGVLITDWTLPDNPIIYVNPAFERLTGYKAEEIIGQNCRFLQNEDRDQPSLKEMRKAIKKGKEFHAILRNYRKDGTLFWNEITISPIFDKEGKLVNFIGIQNDVTKRVEAENALVKSEAELILKKKDLENKNTALKEVLSQIEIDKQKIKDDVVANAEKLLLPNLEKLKLQGVPREYVSVLIRVVKELTSSFGRKLTEESASLTSREIEICNMVKSGLRNKEMARLLNISLHTVERHRRNIRKKLGLANKKLNLTSYLKTL